MKQRPERLLLREALPELASELQLRLIAADEPGLAASVPELRIVDRCRCGDDFCATFYTAPPPRGAYGPSHRNVDLEPEDGYLVLDVVEERIACIEVLYREPIRQRLSELCP